MGAKQVIRDVGRVLDLNQSLIDTLAKSCPKDLTTSYKENNNFKKLVNNSEDLKKLYDIGIMSVLVESGGSLNGSFLPYIDKLYHFIAPKILGDNSGKSCFHGLEIDKISQCTNLKIESLKMYDNDILTIYSK